MNNVKQQYLREVKRLLPYDGSQKKRYLEELTQSVDVFVEEKPEATLCDLYHRFGVPKDIAESYFTHNPEEVPRKLMFRRRFAIIAVTAVLVIIAGVYTATSYLGNKIDDYQQGYWVEIIEEESWDEVPPLPAPVVVYD